MYNLSGVSVKINKKIIILMAVLLLVIRCVMQYITFNFKYTSDTKYTEYVVKITKIKKDEEEKFTAEATICEEDSCKDKVMLNIYDTPDLDVGVGDKVRVKGKLVIPELLNNPGEFNYKRYLNSCGMYATLTTYEVENVDKSGRYTPTKDKIFEKVETALPQDFANLLSAMIYGKKDNLDIAIQNNFKKIGVSHIISVSGTNIAIIISILEYVFKKLRVKRKIRLPLETILVVCFGVISGMEYSVLRAVICNIIGNVCELFKKKIKGVYKLMLSLYVILLLNPYAIFNTSVQLSYTATLGIILFCNRISNFLKNVFKVKETFKKLSRQRRFARGILNGVIGTVSLTMSAQILSLPLQVISFNSLSVMSILANIVICPLSTLVIFLGTIAVIFCFIPIVSTVMFKLLYPLLFLLVKASEVLATITPDDNVPYQQEIVWYAYYMAVGIFFVLDKYFKEKVRIKRKYVTKNIFAKCAVVVLFVLLVVGCNIYTIYYDNYFCFFNVGQGSMCYLKCGQKNILFDCGSTKTTTAYYAMDNFLVSRNISVIHAIYISHFHADHANALADLIENYSVENVYYTPVSDSVNLFNEIQSMANANGTKLKAVYANDIIEYDDFSVEVIYPNKESSNSDELNLNAKSTVYKVEANGKAYLFMGDSGSVAEEYITDSDSLNDIYLLVVGHHGSKTSTSEELVKEIMPEISVISSKKSVYGHPADTVIEILKQFNSRILITEKLGAIKIKI